MKKLITFGAMLLLCALYHAQNFEWARSFGGTSSETGRTITVDPVGNVYTAGFFSETVDFDPGIGTFNLTSNGGQDVFIQKMDGSGNLIWARSFGGAGTGFDDVNTITIDDAGNVYAIGIFEGTVDFDPGVGVYSLSSNGNRDIFVLKMDAFGNFLWARSFGGSGADLGWSVSTDANGNVYTTGAFRGTVDFDPGVGNFNLTSNATINGFIHKMDAAGNFIWAKALNGTDGTSSSNSRSIKAHASGSIYIAGSFRGSIDFDPGTGVHNLTTVTAGQFDIFVQKVDADGNFIWAKSFGGNDSDFAYSMDVDAAGDVYTAGYFLETVDFDPGAGIFNQTSVGNYDAFIQKMDASGNFQWVKTMGGTDYDIAHSVQVDGSGDIYTTGFFQDVVDFDPGSGTSNLTSNGTADVFVQKVDASGNFQWAKSFGGNSQDSGYSIGVSSSGSVYTTGIYQGVVDFDTGTGTSNLVSNGSGDLFVHKLSPCTSATGTDIVSACDSYTWIDGNTYASSNNTATHLISGGAKNGCDSVVTLNLTINHAAMGTDVITACDSYTWIDGNTYASSNNTATHLISGGAKNGCDSVVTLDLTINHAAMGTDVITACDSYTWIDGNTYDCSNHTTTHTIIGGAQNGCDSIVTLDLTINQVSDLTTSVVGNTISANNALATYQWLECDNNFAPIPGEVGQAFTPSNNGNYAVELTENGCVGISACVMISIVGITENSFNQAFSMYPNPSIGNFYIDMGQLYNNTEVTIHNMEGKLVHTQLYYGAQTLEVELDEPTGIYTVKIQADDQISVLKLLKK